MPLDSAGLAEEHARALPQKDDLCGPFWGSIVLRAAGILEVNGEAVDQDLVALAAGALLPPDAQSGLPPGARRRRDYRLSLPLAADVGAAGTSAAGLARAIQRLSDGALAAVPVAGPWTSAGVLGIVEEAAACVALIANLRTGRLWTSRPPAAAVLGYLTGATVKGPPAEWDVGHFVNLALAVSGPRGGLVVVRDSYPELGFEAYYLQPAEALAAALQRGDGRGGGVLCVCGAAEAAGLSSRLAAQGFVIHVWDNGTPFSDDT